MKRRNASLLGNVLMGLGLVVMVVGVGYSILNQLPQLDLPQFFAHGAILSILSAPFSGSQGRALAGMNRLATDTGGSAITINAAVAISTAIAKPVPRPGRLAAGALT